MPAKSKVQFRKAFVLYREGKITKKELDKMTHGVNFASLPARVGKKPKSKVRRLRARKRK